MSKRVSGRKQNNANLVASLSYWDFSAEVPDMKAVFEECIHSYLWDSLLI